MKKVLLILTLALSANAWGEFKTLDCFKEHKWGPDEGKLNLTETDRFTFDPELPDAEIEELKNGECDISDITESCIYPVKVTVFPSYYRFSWQVFNVRNNELVWVETLDLSRKDLTFGSKEDWKISSKQVFTYRGKCELVEVDTSENIL